MKDRFKFDILDQRKALTAVMLIFIAVFAFFINRDIKIEALYMDDLYMWSYYGEQSFFEFVFPSEPTASLRPVYWIFAYIQMALLGEHVGWYAGFNIICNVIVAYSLFYICFKVAGSRFLAFLSSLCYLASRFAYYQIGQAAGLMETQALFFAIWILYLLYTYMNKPNDRTSAELIALGTTGERQEDMSDAGFLKSLLKDVPKPSLKIELVRSYDSYFFGALLLYVLVCFTHERYMSLLPLFYLVLLARYLRERREYRRAWLKENRGKCIAPLAVLFFILLLRILCTGGLVPAGTGGTEVTETFSVTEAVGFALEQVRYIFGINAEGEYLSGLSWANTPEPIRGLIKLSILMLGVIVAMYLISLALYKGGRTLEEQGAFSRHIWNSLLFIGFIALCIGCSSVTIRVEMRWVYVSYTAALIFACYMIAAVKAAYEESFDADRPSKAVTSAAEAGSEAKDAALAAEAESKAKDAVLTEKDDGGSLEDETAPRPEASLSRPGALPGNIFQRMSLTVADRLVGPKVFYAVLCLVFAAYCGLSIYTNAFYRGYFKNIYFWQNQTRMNSLAEETIGSYGADGVLGKDVYILENSYGMSDFYARYFFKPFDKEKTGQGTRIYFVSGPEVISSTALSSGKAIVLEEVPEEDAYRDVTKELKERQY